MDRLVRRGIDGILYCASAGYLDLLNKLAAYEDSGLAPEEITALRNGYLERSRNEEARIKLMYGTGAIPADRCAEITKAEVEGRLLILPCKVGGTVYEHDTVRVYQRTIRGLIFDCGEIAFDENAIGTVLFLTREEAEAALRKEQEAQDG